MKRFLLLCILSISCSTLFAGNKLGDKVQEMLSRVDSCASAEMIGSVVNEYESIIQDYGTDWRSYYWLAYGYMKKADYCFDKANRDKALDKALRYVERSRMLKLQHSETDILEALLLSKKIEIDPDDRTNKYAYQVKERLASAYKLDQLNPRYYLVKGVQSLADTIANPSKKAEAINYLKSSEKLFGPHDRDADKADPTWGFNEAQLFLNVLVPGRETYYNRKGEQVNSLLDAEADSEMKSIEKQLKKEQKKQAKENKKLAKSIAKAANAEDDDSASNKTKSSKSASSKSSKDKKEEEEKEKKEKPKKTRNLP